MRCALLTPKCYSATATVLLGLFAVYGGIGNILYFRELFKFPQKGDWPFNQRFTIYMIMAVNSCYVLAAALGLLAFIGQRIHIFFWSSFILMGSFAFQLIHGVACIRSSFEPMDSAIFSSFRKFQNDHDPTFIKWLLDFQWQYDCCGIKSYMDWELFKTSYSKSDSVPDSCCDRKERIPLPRCGMGLIAPNVTVESARKLINTQGCGDKISDHYQDEIRTKGIVMLLVAFISLWVGIAIFIFHQKIETEQYRERHGRRRNTNTRTERPQRVQRPNAQRNLVNAGNSSPNNNGHIQTDINGNVPKVPSYYKVNVAHKPPTGRMKPPRQDSTRNFQFKNNAMLKNNGPKYRVISHNKHKYNPNFYNPNQNNRALIKSRRGNNNEFLKTKLEMLMHPIETYSTSSATPNSSDLFPFYTAQPSTSACIQPSENFDPRVSSTSRHGHKNSNNLDLKIAQYNSLPQVVTFPDGRVETLNHHYNNSHVHSQNLRRKHSQRPPLNPKNFAGVGIGIGAGVGGGGGKSKFPSLTITSTLATIHEENESVKSGNSQASSTCTTNASSSPKSISSKSSSSKQIEIQIQSLTSSSCNDNADVDGQVGLKELQRTEEDTVLQKREINDQTDNDNDNEIKTKTANRTQDHADSNINVKVSSNPDHQVNISGTGTGLGSQPLPSPTLPHHKNVTNTDPGTGKINDNYSTVLEITASGQ